MRDLIALQDENARLLVFGRKNRKGLDSMTIDLTLEEQEDSGCGQEADYNFGQKEHIREIIRDIGESSALGQNLD